MTNYKWTSLEYKDPTIRIVGPAAIVRFNFVGEQEFSQLRCCCRNELLPYVNRTQARAMEESATVYNALPDTELMRVRHGADQENAAYWAREKSSVMKVLNMLVTRLVHTSLHRVGCHHSGLNELYGKIRVLIVKHCLDKCVTHH